jgi:hypothetical protein
MNELLFVWLLWMLSAPPPITMSDLHVFPPAVEAQWAYQQAHAHHAAIKLAGPAGSQSAEDWQDEVAQAWQTYQAWDMLDNATRWYPPCNRPTALHQLREQLGNRAYYRGEMPPLWAAVAKH